jgi:3-isopropylmalate dehydrogenase
VKAVLSAGLRTADIWSDAIQGTKKVGTREMGDAVVVALTAKTTQTTIKTITTKSS